MGTLSTSQAFTLLENVVGYNMKLDNITVKPLALETWFLTCFMHCLFDTASRQIGQLAPTLPSLPATRTDAVSLGGDDWSGGDDVDESSSDDDDKNDEHLRNNDGLSRSMKHSPWSKEDEDNLHEWKEEGKPWKWICNQFPNRSPAAVRARWYIKLGKKA